MIKSNYETLAYDSTPVFPAFSSFCFTTALPVLFFGVEDGAFPILCFFLLFILWTWFHQSLQFDVLSFKAFVQKERPDLSSLSNNLIKQQNGFTIKMKELEDNILHKLANAEGDITDDVNLIDLEHKLIGSHHVLIWYSWNLCN